MGRVDDDLLAEAEKLCSVQEELLEDVVRELEPYTDARVGDVVDAIADAPGTKNTTAKYSDNYTRMRVVGVESDGRKIFTSSGLWYRPEQLRLVSRPTEKAVEVYDDDDEWDDPEGFAPDDWVCPGCGVVGADDCKLLGWEMQEHSATFEIEDVDDDGYPNMGDTIDTEYNDVSDSGWDYIECPSCGNMYESRFVTRREWREENEDGYRDE